MLFALFALIGSAMQAGANGSLATLYVARYSLVKDCLDFDSSLELELALVQR
jgi:hypothetical protein